MKAQRHELGKDSFQYLCPMMIERATVWGKPQKVIEEGLGEVDREEGAKELMVQLHVDDILKDDAMGKLYHMVVCSIIYLWALRGKHSGSSNKMNPSLRLMMGVRKRWMPPHFIGERRGARYNDNSCVNESIGWLKLCYQAMAAINTKRTIEGKPHASIHSSNGYYYGFHAFEYGKAREVYWDGDKMLEQMFEVIDAFNFLHPDNEANFILGGTKGCKMQATILRGLPNSNIMVQEELPDGTEGHSRKGMFST